LEVDDKNLYIIEIEVLEEEVLYPSVNEINLLDILKSASEDVVDMVQLNMELEKFTKCIGILDEREKSDYQSDFALICNGKSPKS
jgi:hypothetical protein